MTPSTLSRGRVRPTRVLSLGAVSLLLVVALTSCLSTPGRTDRIELVTTTVVDGWNVSYYRNKAYPCSISGYQTFAIGTKVGSSDTATRPLWVKMHGGGVGWFAADGSPMPTAGQKTEESLAQLAKYDTAGLMANVKAAPEGFRLLVVSMCSHDIYSGDNTADPHNPNTTPDGAPRPTTGLPATKAAIQFTMDRFPTDDFFLHGTSAGGAGTFSVAWALQQQGIPPAGIVSDSGVLSQAWEQYVAANGVPGGSEGCQKATDDRATSVPLRLAPDLVNPANQPHLLISSGRLTVPVVHVWNRNDQNSCGAAPIPCPMPDGSTQTMGASECRHAPVRLAILGQGASSKSLDLRVCVEGGDTTYPCDRHVVTTMANGRSSEPGGPADYQATILDWVRTRLADD